MQLKVKQHRTTTWVYTSTASELMDRIKGADPIIIIDKELTVLTQTALQKIFVGKNKKVYSCLPRKDWKNLLKLLTWFHDIQVTKHHKVYVIGGGTLQDLAMLACSLFHRGLQTCLVPTTLLSMVDSTIGGKNAIDFQGAKNQIGSFYPPHEVMIITDFLHSLSDDQWLSGWGEIAKYSYLKNSPMLTSSLSQFTKGISHFNKEKLQSLIFQCLRIKKQYVEKDEFENLKLRYALNFGHSLGHGIENHFHLPHGLAVVHGLRFDLFCSWKLKKMTKKQLIKFLTRLHDFPTTHELLCHKVPIDRIMDFMVRDKKNVNHHTLTITLLQSPVDKDASFMIQNHQVSLQKLENLFRAFIDEIKILERQ